MGDSGRWSRRSHEEGAHRGLGSGCKSGCSNHAFREESQSEESWENSGAEHLVCWDVSGSFGPRLYMICGDSELQGHYWIPTMLSVFRIGDSAEEVEAWRTACSNYRCADNRATSWCCVMCDLG